MFKRMLAIGAAAAGLSAFAAMPATALPLSVMNPGGFAQFEDDSGEFLLRDDGSGTLVPVAPGDDIAVGDIFAGVFDISSIGGTTLDTLNTEITGVFLTVVTALSDLDTETIGATTFDTVDLTFGADASLFSDVFGIADPVADTVALLFEDTDNDFSFFGADVTDIPGSIATAVDGVDFMRLELDPDGFFTSNDVPLQPGTFGAFPTNTQLGTFSFDLLIAEYFGPGTLVNPRTGIGSGNLFVPQADNVFPVEDDVQFTLQVIPVPATLGLLGMGLLGLGLIARRRRYDA